MNTHDNLLKSRFHINMSRINGLVNLIFYDVDQLRPTGLFQSDGTRADILRTIVVFLHATFEDVLRSKLSKVNKSISFYSRTDIEKALKQSGVDAKPFRIIYLPLIQMAKRRKRIVHEADFLDRNDTMPKKWDIVDDWQLIMWLMAVPAFYYQLRITTKEASEIEIAKHERINKAMQSHVDFGKQLLSFSSVPHELRLNAIQEMINTLETITSTLTMDA